MGTKPVMSLKAGHRGRFANALRPTEGQEFMETGLALRGKTEGLYFISLG